MKKFFSDFKKFIMRGNVVDMAVGVIVGGAFGKIVTSLVNDIVMPVICSLFSTQSVTDLVFKINGTPIYIGKFFSSILDFFIIAFFVYSAVRLLAMADEQLGELKKKSRRETTAKERKLLKKSGMTKKDILVLEEERRVARVEKAKLEASQVVTPETSDQILKDIRELMKQQLRVNKTPSKKNKTT